MLTLFNPHAAILGRGRRFVPLVAIITFALAGTLHAAPFQNLDFEQATMQPAPANSVPWDAYLPISAAAALPYWTVEEDGTVCTAVWNQDQALDETSVGLISPSVTVPGFPTPFTGNPIQDTYSVELYAFAGAPSGYFHTASISQTGDVPADAKSIFFYIQYPFVGANFANPIVSLDGNTIDVFPLSTSHGATLMGGDIRAFAGATAELTFSAIGPDLPMPNDEDIYELDDISFSPNPIPEPASAALLLAGLPLLAIRRRRA